MPRHLISDAHEWTNKNIAVFLKILVKLQLKERFWLKQRGKKSVLSLTLVFSEKYFSDFRCNKFILADGIKEVVKIKRKKNEIYSPKNIVKRYYSFFKTIMND